MKLYNCTPFVHPFLGFRGVHQVQQMYKQSHIHENKFNIIFCKSNKRKHKKLNKNKFISRYNI
ncbi:conserved hypothetical protein [Capnocytophaga canimorsus]|nr:conserved hypothetical protein [Capnocytophaga canimorsus]